MPDIIISLQDPTFQRLVAALQLPNAKDPLLGVQQAIMRFLKNTVLAFETQATVQTSKQQVIDIGTSLGQEVWDVKVDPVTPSSV